MIHVTVAGEVGVGKTAICQLLQEALESRGFVVSVQVGLRTGLDAHDDLEESLRKMKDHVVVRIDETVAHFGETL